MKYTIELVHISEIKPGNTVEINGMLKTVCKNNITVGFMGRTLFGDSYRLGTKPVRRANIFRAMPWGKL